MTWDDIPLAFCPISQDLPSRATLVARTDKDETSLAAAIQKQISSFDPTVPVAAPQTMDHLLSRNLAYPKFRATLFAIFAALAILLAGIGLYGVLSQAVAHRKQELALRFVLGARRRDVVLMIVGQGLFLIMIGLGAGLLLTLWLTRYLGSLLYAVQVNDPLTLVWACLTLLAVGAGATFIPTLRASTLGSFLTLKYE